MEKTCQFTDCGSKHYARGWCSSHYQQWRTGMPIKAIKATGPRNTVYKGIKRNDPNKFWLLTESQGECVVWLGRRYPNGYGEFVQHRKSHLAHRYSYTEKFGEIPEGMLVDHTCHNKACVNPEHLRLASVKQNQENMSGLRSNNTSGYRGVSKMGRKWRATMTHAGQFMHLGSFDTPEEAAEVVRLKRVELYTHNIIDRAA